MNKQIEGLDGKITDVKDRLNRVEAMSIGAAGNRSDSQQSSHNVFVGVAAISGVVAVLISLATVIYTATRPTPEVHVTGNLSQPQRMIAPRI